MDAGVSSTCACVCSLRVHSHACTPPSVRCERGRERERGGRERGFRVPVGVPGTRSRTGDKAFGLYRTFIEVLGRQLLARQTTRVSTVVATTNRSTIHVRYKHHPTHWTEELPFTLYCSPRALSSEDVSFSSQIVFSRGSTSFTFCYLISSYIY